MEVSNYNLRVYGLLFHENSILISHERRNGFLMTKFPGGGLEKGEGLADCLVREFDEELEIAIEVQDHFYVNDFLQISAFNSADQLISFYYKVASAEIDKLFIDPKKNLEENDQVFEWKLLKDLNIDDFTFPLDKVVVEKLLLLHS